MNVEISDAVREAAIAEYSVDAFMVAPEVLLMLLPMETYEKIEALSSKAVLARIKYGEASAALEKFRKDYPGVVVDSKGKGVRARRLRDASLKAARKMRASYLNVGVFIEEIRPLFESVVAAFARQLESNDEAFFGMFWESLFKITREKARYFLGVPVTATVEDVLARSITTLVKIHECKKIDDDLIVSSDDMSERIELLQQDAVGLAQEMQSLLQDLHKAINPTMGEASPVAAMRAA